MQSPHPQEATPQTAPGRSPPQRTISSGLYPTWRHETLLLPFRHTGSRGAPEHPRRPLALLTSGTVGRAASLCVLASVLRRGLDACTPGSARLSLPPSPPCVCKRKTQPGASGHTPLSVARRCARTPADTVPVLCAAADVRRPLAALRARSPLQACSSLCWRGALGQTPPPVARRCARTAVLIRLRRRSPCLLTPCRRPPRRRLAEACALVHVAGLQGAPAMPPPPAAARRKRPAHVVRRAASACARPTRGRGRPSPAARSYWPGAVCACIGGFFAHSGTIARTFAAETMAVGRRDRALQRAADARRRVAKRTVSWLARARVRQP